MGGGLHPMARWHLGGSCIGVLGVQRHCRGHLQPSVTVQRAPRAGLASTSDTGHAGGSPWPFSPSPPPIPVWNRAQPPPPPQTWGHSSDRPFCCHRASSDTELRLGTILGGSARGAPLPGQAHWGDFTSTPVLETPERLT